MSFCVSDVFGCPMSPQAPTAPPCLSLALGGWQKAQTAEKEES